MLTLFVLILVVAVILWAVCAATGRYSWGAPYPIGGLIAVLFILVAILVLTGNLAL